MLIAYPIGLKNFMHSSVHGHGMLSELERAVADVMYSHMENDLHELAGIAGVSYEDLVKKSHQTLTLGDLTLRIISPESLRYSNFMNMNKETNVDLMSIGRAAVAAQDTQ